LGPCLHSTTICVIHKKQFHLTKPFKVAGASFPNPASTEIVIKNRAVAINPIDWKVQNGVIDYVDEFPFVLGEDVAGTVEVVGFEVKHVKQGDRVIGWVSRFFVSSSH
jgi:NADPH:quinone reductase-like Zn-dependent oxidoreductase